MTPRQAGWLAGWLNGCLYGHAPCLPIWLVSLAAGQKALWYFGNSLCICCYGSLRGTFCNHPLSPTTIPMYIMQFFHVAITCDAGDNDSYYQIYGYTDAVRLNRWMDGRTDGRSDGWMKRQLLVEYSRGLCQMHVRGCFCGLCFVNIILRYSPLKLVVVIHLIRVFTQKKIFCC